MKNKLLTVLRGLAWPLAGRPAGGRKNQEATDAHCEQIERKFLETF